MKCEPGIEVLSKAGNKGTAENGPEGCAVGHLGGCCGRVPLLACTHTCMLTGDSPLADSSCLSQRCQEYVCGGVGRREDPSQGPPATD